MISLALSVTAGQQVQLQTTPQLRNDSFLQRLQYFIDSQYQIIDIYYKTNWGKQHSEKGNQHLNGRLQEIDDSIHRLLSLAFNKFCGQTSALSTGDLTLELKSVYNSLIRLEQEAGEVKSKVTDTLFANLDSSKNIEKAEFARYNAVNIALTALSKNIKGAGILDVPVNGRHSRYRFFIASKPEYTVRVHNSTDGPSSIGKLVNTLSKTAHPVMVTNGGMFRPGYDAQGLLIEDARLLHALDTDRPSNSGLNFYLLPNAVFYMDHSGSFKIDETGDFEKAYPQPYNELPLFATQSGPLLFSKSIINSNFRPGSTNFNIRNGVGVIDSNKVVFIISDTPVNFHEFTLVFKEIFHCTSALYLDGAISEMYISEQMLKNNNAVINGNFGPLISVTKNKK